MNKSHRDIKGETFVNGVPDFRAKTVHIPKQKREEMGSIKKFIVKQALPYFIENIDVDADAEIDGALNIMNYSITIKLFGQTIIKKEGVKSLP